MQGIEVTGTGPVVIFLHSSLSSNRQWLPTIAKLSRRYRCINIDLLGYGNAPKPDTNISFDFTQELQRIDQALGQLQSTEKIHIIGHSYGGALALAWAIRHSNNIASLSLYEPVAFHLLKNKHPNEFWEINEFAAMLASHSDIQAVSLFVDFWNGEGFFSALPDKVKLQMTKAMGKVHDDFSALLSEEYSLSCMLAFTFPVLLMVGNETQEVSKILSSAIAAHIVDKDIRYVSAGHMGPISHANDVASLIGDFFITNEAKR